jgi:hypothetical protein
LKARLYKRSKNYIKEKQNSKEEGIKERKVVIIEERKEIKREK